MAQNFIACGREQSFLLPPDVRDWLPEGHFAWFVLDAVEEFDLDCFYAVYRRDGMGRPAYDPKVMGRIQLVVATLDDEELRCRGEMPLLLVLLQRGRVSAVVRRRGTGSIASGSGKRSLAVPRVRRLRSRRKCCRALVSGGFVRVAACRHCLSRQCPGAICRSLSGRRSQCCSPAVMGSGKSRVDSVGRRRRSPESCSATRRLDAAELSIERRPLRGMRSVALGDPSRRSSL
jgi:hypothetical protein